MFFARRSLPLLLLAVLLLSMAACSEETNQNPNANSDVQDEDTGTDIGSDMGSNDDPDASEDAIDDVEDTPPPDLSNLPEMPWSVEERGHFNIGYRVEQVEYTPLIGSSRKLRLAIWYPTVETQDRNIAYFGAARPDVYTDVAPALLEPAPILIFSHGSNGFAEQTYSMTEFFASHGWIVVSPDHTGNTFVDVGRGIAPATLQHRPQDISAVIDTIQNLPSDDPLAPFISDDIVLSGHSFGGYTTLAVAGASFDLTTFIELCGTDVRLQVFCEYFAEDGVSDLFDTGFGDDRIKLAIPLAPFGGPAFGGGEADIDIPVLLMTALEDKTLPPSQDGDPIWAALDGPDDIRLDFLTGGHFTFSDACELSELLGLAVGDNDGCSPLNIGPEQAFYLINAYAMAFARYHLQDDDTDLDLLTGERSLDNGSVRFYSK